MTGMFVSYSHKFIFVHIYKTAGISVKHALKDYVPFSCDWGVKAKDAETIRAFHNKCKDILSFHSDILRFKSIMPEEVFKTFFKFAFVRNPWDWLVSHYTYIKNNINHHHYIKVNKMSFREFIEWRISLNVPRQIDFISNGDGSLAVDYVGKVETINKDFECILSILNIDNITLPHSNKSKRAHYSKYYNDILAERVYDYFKKDIDYFDYKFNS